MLKGSVLQEGVAVWKVPTCVCVLSRVWLFATLWTVAHQAPLFMAFFRQGYWSGLSFPFSGDPPNPGTEPESPVSPALAGWFFTTEPPGKPYNKQQNCRIAQRLWVRLYIWSWSHWRNNRAERRVEERMEY